MALAIYSMKSKESESLINGKYKLTITQNHQLKISDGENEWLFEIDSLFNPITSIYNFPIIKDGGITHEDTTLINSLDSLITSVIGYKEFHPNSSIYKYSFVDKNVNNEYQLMETNTTLTEALNKLSVSLISSIFDPTKTIFRFPIIQNEQVLHNQITLMDSLNNIASATNNIKTFNPTNTKYDFPFINYSENKYFVNNINATLMENINNVISNLVPLLNKSFEYLTKEIIMNDTEIQEVLKGPKGDKGDKGDTGLKGEDGEDVDTGKTIASLILSSISAIGVLGEGLALYAIQNEIQLLSTAVATLASQGLADNLSDLFTDGFQSVKGITEFTSSGNIFKDIGNAMSKGFNNLKNKFNGGFQRLNEVGDIANNLGVDELSDISSSISEFSDMDLIDINSYTIPGENVLFDLVDSLI